MTKSHVKKAVTETILESQSSSDSASARSSKVRPALAPARISVRESQLGIQHRLRSKKKPPVKNHQSKILMKSGVAIEKVPIKKKTARLVKPRQTLFSLKYNAQP